MAYDVTGFTDYVGRENEFLTATLFSGGDTGKFARFMTGVKGKTSIPKIDGEAVIQKGACKDPSGDTDITEEFIEVVQWEYHEAFCEDDLQVKFPNMVLAPGSNNEGDTPPMWQETVVDVKISSIQKTIELTYWQGDTAGTYTLFDGFIKKIDAAGTAVEGNTSGATAITIANVEGLVDDIIDAADVDVRESDDFTIVCGNDTFSKYIKAMKVAKSYWQDPKNDGDTYIIAGSEVILRKVRGINGTERMFAGRGSAFVVGMDVKEEADVIDIFYVKGEDKVHFRTKAKSGVTPVNIDEMVEFTLAV